MTNYLRGILRGSALFCLLAISIPSFALVINATDSGWYHPSVGHYSTNTNYAAGPNDTYRNFFVFDLSGLSGVVMSATLRLETDPNWVNGTPNYEIYDVTTSITTLVTSHSPGSTTDAIHTDLGSGVLYGSGTVTNATNLVTIQLKTEESA